MAWVGLRWFLYSAVFGSSMALGVACSGSKTPAKTPAEQAPTPAPGVIAPGPVGPEETCEGGEPNVHRYTPVQCSPTCTAHATEIRRCVSNRWTSERVEADCRPCPSAVPPDIADCTFEQMTLRPGEQSPLDMCRLELHCGGTLVETLCDGENDGTGTSLCECKRDGVRDEHILKDLYQGEGPEPCFAAAAHCRSPRPERPGLKD